jgi:hypothetical protein
MDVFLLCVLSGRGLCNELITRPEQSYRLWCVVVCDLETSRMRTPWPTGGRGGGLSRQKQTIFVLSKLQSDLELTLIYLKADCPYARWRKHEVTNDICQIN